ncbi:hypothetical protein ABEX67_06705 [Bacillus wiedmannii]|uniref:hypothetical protein n=1 Tax=Bacillus wiedmannii TaxID=1890302 RepID=UPI003D1E0FE7
MHSAEISIEDAYAIFEEADASTGFAKRISLKLILKKPLSLVQIKKVAIKVFEEYKLKNDVITIFIAKSKEDCERINWVLRAQWISNTLNKDFRPLPIGELDTDGYYWNIENSYCITAEFYQEIDKTDFGKFIPTIPFSPNPLIVDFNLDIVTTLDGKITASGTTNLYDKAKVSLRIYNSFEERIFIDETIVEDGTFIFKSLAEQIKPLKTGTYTVELFVALPSTQHEEFRNKAGIEYENLSGPCIVREGLLGPTIVYEQKFSI